VRRKNQGEGILRLRVESEQGRIRNGNGVEWGRILPSPSPYPTLIYLPVTLLISNGDEKSNLILVADGFGYTHLIPIRIIFLNKNKSIFQSRSQCCPALSRMYIMNINSYGEREDRSQQCEI